MSKHRFLAILGVLVAVMPFLGFPLSWRKTFFVVFGVLIVITSYRLSAELKRLKKEEDISSPFKENQE